MSEQHAAAWRVLSVAIEYSPELWSMSGQGAVVSDYIDRLALGHDERFLHDSPTWTDDEGVVVPVTEQSHTLVVIHHGLRRSISRQRGLLAERGDRDQIPLVSVAVPQDDWCHLRLACFGSRRAFVSIDELRQFSRRRLRDVNMVQLERRRLRLGRRLSNCCGGG